MCSSVGVEVIGGGGGTQGSGVGMCSVCTDTRLLTDSGLSIGLGLGLRFVFSEDSGARMCSV